MLIRYRKTLAIILMVLGTIMLVRGLMYSMQKELGWQGAIQASVAGALVFALGLVRWRYLRQR